MTSAPLPSLAEPFAAAARVAARHVRGAPLEVAAFVYCDRGGGVLGTRRIESQEVDQTHLTLRRIAVDALHLGASALVMAHNHPRGDAGPSAADRHTTRRLAQMLQALDVRLHDHLVVGQNGDCWSFRAAGLL